jgi:uncharacterized membrane protein YtjA (UPF0391 family)
LAICIDAIASAISRDCATIAAALPFGMSAAGEDWIISLLIVFVPFFVVFLKIS